MPVPKYNELYGPFLKMLEDGQVHDFKEIKNAIANMFNISEADLMKRLPSGKKTVFDDRVGWAKTYLKKAGLLDNPEKGKYILTDEGKKVLPDINIIDDNYLARYESFRIFKNLKENINPENQSNIEKSPEEILEDAFKTVNASLADDLMSEIMKLTPTDFEYLVVELLQKMGYGSGIDDAGFVTQASNDGGIDGIIKEDQLGFSSIYIQAKQWDPSKTVSRPEIQKFAGALHEHNGVKGLFITTASFSNGAKESAKSSGIVLVDGQQLAKLMIKHNLGVSIEHVYEVKRIDSDFFG